MIFRRGKLELCSPKVPRKIDASEWGLDRRISDDSGSVVNVR